MHASTIAFSILTISLAFQVGSLEGIEAQLRILTENSCTLSADQPSDPVEMQSGRQAVHADDTPEDDLHTIHIEKQIFECPSSPPIQEPYKVDITIFTNLYSPLLSLDIQPRITHFSNFIKCHITKLGTVGSCSTPAIEGVTSALTRCNEESIGHPLEMNSFSLPGPKTNPDYYLLRFLTSDTHVYKCYSGNVPVPNKVKIVTIFTSTSSNYVSYPSAWFLTTTCVEDIPRAIVEACMASTPPRNP